MRPKLFILICSFLFPYGIYAQQVYTGSNKCLILISTDTRNYKFNATNMYARLNESLKRFEFIIPLNSIQSVGDSVDVKFLEAFASGSDIIINAPLPEVKDSGLNLSNFNGNKFIKLAGEINIGKFNFESDIEFKGILMGDTNKMAFDFKVFLNEQSSYPMQKVDNEQIIEINMAARGDKIIGLLPN